MTKKLIDRLEELADEMKVIVHQLRVPSTIQTVEDVIEYEGQQYKKVDRSARAGDYVSVSFEKGKCFKPNKIYGPVFNDNDLKVKADPSSGGEFEITLVYNNFYDRTPETVDVYELIVEDIPFDSVDYPIDYPPEEEKTPNQQRAEVIRKAKEFIPKKLKGQYYLDPFHVVSFSNTKGFAASHDVKFIVNEKKNTVVALIIHEHFGDVQYRGIAKCMPTDVFNADIGKAIALGRALGLDVSEFENAVQPTEKVVGQIVKVDHREAELKPDDFTSFIGAGTVCLNSHYGQIGVIINDTNAIYTDGEQS